jgi:hypothetical protein
LDPNDQVNTVEGKAFATLVGFLTFAVTACYTANLVSFLNISPDAPIYASRREFETAGETACALTGLRTRLERSYPTLEVATYPDWADIEAAFLRGDCSGIVGAKTNLLAMGDFACNLAEADEMFSIRFGQPVAHTYEPLYSAHLMEAAEAMKVQELTNTHQSVSTCKLRFSSDEDMQLGLTDLTLFLSTIVFIYLGIVLWMREKRRRIENAEDTGKFGRVDATALRAVRRFSVISERPVE